MCELLIDNNAVLSNQDFLRLCEDKQIKLMKKVIENMDLSEKKFGNELINMALKNNNDELLNLLIENKVNFEENIELTLFNNACNNNEKIKEILYKNNLQYNTIDFKNFHGTTPLIKAIESNDMDLIINCLENNVNLEIISSKGTALQIATKMKNKEVVQLLIDKGAKINYSQTQNIWTHINNHPLVIACRQNDHEIINMLISKEVWRESIIEALNDSGKNGNIEIIKKFIDYETKYENLAFVNACENGHLEIINYLIVIDKKTLKKYEREAFVRACGNGQLEIVNHLIKIDKKILKKCGQIALIHSCKKGQVEILELLLKNNVRLRKIGSEALLRACENGHLEIVEILLNERKKYFFKYDINYHKEDDYNNVLKLNRIPLVKAIENKHLEIVKTLIRYRVNTEVINIIDMIMEFDNTKDNLEMIQIILKNTYYPQRVFNSELNKKLDNLKEEKDISKAELIISEIKKILNEIQRIKNSEDSTCYHGSNVNYEGDQEADSWNGNDNDSEW
jgi:ankyrin repeat protein